MWTTAQFGTRPPFGLVPGLVVFTSLRGVASSLGMSFAAVWEWVDGIELGWGKVAWAWWGSGRVVVWGAEDGGDFGDSGSDVCDFVVGWWLALRVAVRALGRRWQCVGDGSVLAPPGSEVGDNLGVSREPLALGCNVVERGLGESGGWEVVEEERGIGAEFEFGVVCGHASVAGEDTEGDDPFADGVGWRWLGDAHQ